MKGKGIEPLTSQPQCNILPLNYPSITCYLLLLKYAIMPQKNFSPVEGFEPSTSDLKSNVLPSKLHRISGWWELNPHQLIPNQPCYPLHHIQPKNKLARIGIEPIFSD